MIAGMSNDDDFDLQDFLPYLLTQAAEACGREYQSIYKGRYGLLRSEWRVLFHLGRYGDMTAREIVHRASTHKTKVSRAVRALELKRYLRRDVVETDRRSEMLSLTKAGRAVYKDLELAARDYDRALSSTLKADEQAILRKILKSLAKIN